MRNTLIVICAIIAFNSAFSQNNSLDKYFPREQLTCSDCNEASDKNLCLYDLLGDAITGVLNAELQELRINDDTLNISVGFSLTNKGRIDKLPLKIQVSNKLLRKESYFSIENSIKNLPRFDITNRKPDEFRSIHIFEYTYILEKNVTPYKAKRIETDKTYEGGTVFELPVYPGCENLTYSKTANCFNIKTQQHILKHFNYPLDALKNNIQGKVVVSFVINKEGKIEDIKTDGGAYILQVEAIRIIELLPQFQPAKQNGEPTKIPFTIPIDFKLSKQ